MAPGLDFRMSDRKAVSTTHHRVAHTEYLEYHRQGMTLVVNGITAVRRRPSVDRNARKWKDGVNSWVPSNELGAVLLPRRHSRAASV